MTARKQSLDVLRCAAILLVMVHHYGLPEKWVSFGWSGVDLFFVLSGFLIARLLFTEYQESGSIKLKRFWIRRGFKIYPAFYAHMLFVILVLILLRHGLPRKILSDLFFLQDYIRPVADHGWSLGVEEKFYLFLPLLLVGLTRFIKSVRALPYIYVGLLVGCLLMRYFALGGSILKVIHPAHLRMDSLFFGVTLAYYRFYHSPGFRSLARFPLWLAGLALISPAFFLPMSHPWMATAGICFVTMGYGLILMWTVDRYFSKSPILRAMAWVGQYSYSIYLWHLMVRDVFGLSYDVHHTLWLLPLYFAAAIAVGYGAAYLIEVPFLRLRDKLEPARESIPNQMAMPEKLPSTH